MFVMAKKPETLFGEKVDQDLKAEFGKECWCENIQQSTKSGTPDRLICISGMFFGLELKLDGEKPTAIQKLKLGKIQRAGGYACIATPSTWHIVLEEIKDVVKHDLCLIDSSAYLPQ